MCCWACMFADARYQSPYDIYLFIYLFIHSFILLEIGTILVLTDKNQPTNQKYSHTYIKLNNINIHINVKT